MTDDAEKEASEVLHSLLSVERIEKRDNFVVDTATHGQIVWTSGAQAKTNGLDSSSGQNTWNNDVEMNNDTMDSDDESDKQNELVDVESCNDAPDTIEDNAFSTTKSSAPNAALDCDPEETNSTFSSSKLESSAAEVKHKFAQGCDCTESNCFSGLNEEAVFRHRLNVAELTREEHDMYLMGVTMACLGVSSQTHRNKERQRQRATYVHKGKRVCLDAFLYLENVTQYHLKRIRQHVMTQGVVPRVHGNIGKKPHNTFSLDMYKCAEHFIKQTIAEHQSGGSSGGDSRPLFVASETRSTIYEKFRQSPLHPEGGKIMGYTTFRHFIKKQFPNVRFAAGVSPLQTKGRLGRKGGARGASKATDPGASRSLHYTSGHKEEKSTSDPT